MFRSIGVFKDTGLITWRTPTGALGYECVRRLARYAPSIMTLQVGRAC